MNVGKSITPTVYPRFVDARQPIFIPSAHDSFERMENQSLTISGMDFPKEIGRRIKAARNEKGWSLVELSRQTNDLLSDTRIGNYETGFRSPGPPEAVILAKALGKRPAYLMAIDDAQLPIFPKEEELIKNWRVLPENERMSRFREIEQLAMVYRDAVPNTKVEHLSAKGKTSPLQKSKVRN